MVSCGTRLAVRADRVDDYLRAEMEKRHIPGLSVAVVKAGKIVKKRGYGLANIEFAVPATEHTLYQLASVTKSFTGVATMLLVEEGKLTLQDKLGNLLADMPSSWQNITLYQLLTHTSGLPDCVGLPPNSPDRDDTCSEILSKLARLPVISAPGEQWAYIQTDYLLLGLIIAKQSGKSFPDFLQERVLTPIGISDARFGDAGFVIQNRAIGYERDEEGVLRMRTYRYPEWVYTAAGLNASVLSMAKWAQAIQSRKLLSEAGWQAVWTPAKLNAAQTFDYGFGWEIQRFGTHRAVGHQGGGNAVFIHYPEDKLTVIVLTNLMASQPEALAQHLATFYLPTLATRQEPQRSKRPQ